MRIFRLPRTPKSTPNAGSNWSPAAACAALRGNSPTHAGFLGYDDGVLRLSLSAADEHLKMPGLVKRACRCARAGARRARRRSASKPRQAAAETLHQRSARERDARQVAAEAAFMADPGVQRLMQQHGATLVPDSIRPFDE